MLKIPKLKVIAELNPDKKAEIEKMIHDALQNDYMQSYPIERLDNEQLIILSEYANKNNIIVTLTAEHSNLHQGVLVNILDRDYQETFAKYL